VNFFPHAGVYIGGVETKLRIDTLQNIQPSFKGEAVDIIETQLGTTEDKLPKDFSGCSRDGMYQTRERQIGDQFKIEEMLLAGVFIAGNEEAGWLYSRGHMALYDIFCRFLDEGPLRPRKNRDAERFYQAFLHLSNPLPFHNGT